MMCSISINPITRCAQSVLVHPSHDVLNQYQSHHTMCSISISPPITWCAQSVSIQATQEPPHLPRVVFGWDWLRWSAWIVAENNCNHKFNTKYALINLIRNAFQILGSISLIIIWNVWKLLKMARRMFSVMIRPVLCSKLIFSLQIIS